MKRIRFLRWEIEIDSDATRRFHDQHGGAPESCGCTACLNFARARETIYPALVRDLFDRVGIDYRKEVEIYHNGKLDSGLHSYGGWFHACGRLVSGNDAAIPMGDTGWRFELERVSESFAVGLTMRTDLAPPEYEGELIQIEFAADVPWLLDEPEPT